MVAVRVRDHSESDLSVGSRWTSAALVPRFMIAASSDIVAISAPASPTSLGRYIRATTSQNSYPSSELTAVVSMIQTLLRRSDWRATADQARDSRDRVGTASSSIG